jgi:hypothetical protein
MNVCEGLSGGGVSGKPPNSICKRGVGKDELVQGTLYSSMEVSQGNFKIKNNKNKLFKKKKEKKCVLSELKTLRVHLQAGPGKQSGSRGRMGKGTDSGNKTKEVP